MVETVQYWRFFDLVKGRNVIEDWRAGIGSTGRLAMDALLKNTTKIENQLEWGARDLKGAPKKEKVFELKFKADKKEYRLAFIFQPEHSVILLMGFYHKQKVYYPPDAIKTARNRAEDYRANRANAIERKISLYL
jgi:mRNA-degrading endonuclease RelE of RelBE toxin-antitoxin system